MIDIADAVSGRAGLEGLRWMLLSGAPRRVVRRELEALLSRPNLLGRCHLRFASFRPASRVKAYYDAYVRAEPAGSYTVRPIAVKWKLYGRQSAAGLAKMEAEALLHNVAAPFLGLVADVPALSMRLQVAPLDARFPQLVLLSNPQHVGAIFARACAASDGSPDPAPGRRFAVTYVRYRPGKCHVLRYDSFDGDEPRAFFVKLYPGEAGRKAFGVATRIRAWLAEHGEGVTSARPLAYVAEDAIVLYPKVSGTPLSRRLWRPGRGVARWLECAGTALLALHQVPQAVSGALEFYDFAAEIRDTAKVSSHVPVLLPSAGAAIQAVLDQAQELHGRVSAEPPSFAHRDFKSEHLWVARSRLTLMDLDNCRWADPALDVGKFLADLRFWFATYNQQGLENAQGQFLAGYARGVPSERLTRARLYEAVELVRMAALRVGLLEPNWAHRTERLIGRAQAVINQLQLLLGLPTRRHFSLISRDTRHSPGATRRVREGRE